MTRPATSSIPARAAAFAERSDISARSLLVTVWGDTIEPLTSTLWLARLFTLMSPFPFTERLLRTSLSRLAAEGWVVSDRDGRHSRYTLTDAARCETLEAETRIYANPEPLWTGRWRLIMLDDAKNDTEQFAGTGIAVIGPRLLGIPQCVNAANFPVGGQLLLDRVGIDQLPVADARFESSGWFEDPDRVIDAFGLRELSEAYRRFLGEFGSISVDEAAALAPADGFALRTMLLHQYRRIRMRDPLVPGELLSDRWPASAAHQLASDLYNACTDAAWDWARRCLDIDAGPLASRVSDRLLSPIDQSLAR